MKEILWSTFAWTEGGYGFSPMRPQRADLVKLSLFPGDLILEGVLKQETLVALRQKMPRARRLFPTAAPPYALHELKLTGPQAMLLAYADGTKTVEDLLALTDLLGARDAGHAARPGADGHPPGAARGAQQAPHHLRALSRELTPAHAPPAPAQHRGQPREPQRREPRAPARHSRTRGQRLRLAAARQERPRTKDWPRSARLRAAAGAPRT